MAQFLSDEWFAEVDRIRAEAGEEGAITGDLVLNIVVEEGPDGHIEIHSKGGQMERGLAADAPTTLRLPYAVAYAMFIKADQAAATQAFMSGQIKVEGDMSKLMALQSQPQPDPTIVSAIAAMTDAIA